MEISGYMTEVSLTDDALTVVGKNKAARIALRGDDHGDGPVVIPRDRIRHVKNKRANALVNGKVTVETSDGTYQLHYRRKSQADFDRLTAALLPQTTR